MEWMYMVFFSGIVHCCTYSRRRHSFWGDPSCRIFSERLTCAATVDNTEPIQSNIKSATCRTNASIIKAFPQTSLSAFVASSRHCYRKDSFASHVYQNTHNKNNNTKVISDVFDSCSLRLNKQQRVWEWCLGTNFGRDFLVTEPVHRLISKVCQKQQNMSMVSWWLLYRKNG